METSVKHISLEKAYEARHWCRVLDLNLRELRRAVALVGTNIEALTAYRANAGHGVQWCPSYT